MYQPKPETPVKTYLFSYIHRGEVHEMAVDAYSPGDAMVKVGRMGEARMEGELVEELIPVLPKFRNVVMSTQN